MEPSVLINGEPVRDTSRLVSSEDKPTLITFDRNQILGKGGYSYVFRGTLNGTDVAVKRIQRLLVLELCVGTVQDYITEKYRGPMPEERIALKQMTKGLAFIHKMNFLHRDIKPENVLISKSAILKISDFGFSKSFTTASGSVSGSSGFRGTLAYSAPEYHHDQNKWKSKEENKKIEANKSLDVFSLGCVFFTYLKKTQGAHLFAEPRETYEINDKYKLEIITNIVAGKRFLREGLTENHHAYNMIDGMTRFASNERWTLNQVEECLENLPL